MLPAQNPNPKPKHTHLHVLRYARVCVRNVINWTLKVACGFTAQCRTAILNCFPTHDCEKLFDAVWQRDCTRHKLSGQAPERGNKVAAYDRVSSIIERGLHLLGRRIGWKRLKLDGWIIDVRGTLKCGARKRL